MFFGYLRINEIIKSITNFSFTEFDTKWKERHGSLSKVKDVYSMFLDYSKQLSDNDQTSTASSYKNALISLQLFVNDSRRKILPFEFVTCSFLMRYEKWMEAKGNSPTTTGMYVRSLRCILNQAIEEGLMPQTAYPFGKRKYQIPASRNIKKALEKTDLKKIIDYVPSTNSEAKYRDLWLFSYLCNGANIKDIAHLKFSNVNSTSILFVRFKTVHSTKTDQQPIVVMLIPKIREILELWGNRTHPNNFIFGIIEEKDNSITRKTKVNQVTKLINRYIKKICLQVGIEDHVTTYTARHTFATTMKRSGASIDMIGECLGHKDRKTTERYLGSFENDVKLIFQNLLMDF